MTDKITDVEFLHDFYARFHAAAEAHPDPTEAAALRLIAEHTRFMFKMAGRVAQHARQVAGIREPQAYAACSAAQSAAQRVVDAIEEQVF